MLDPSFSPRVSTLRKMLPHLSIQSALPPARSCGLRGLVLLTVGTALGLSVGLASAQDPRDGGRPGRALHQQRGRELSHLPVTAAVAPGPVQRTPGGDPRDYPWGRASPQQPRAIAEGLTAEQREALRAARRGGIEPPGLAVPGSGAAATPDPVHRMTPEQRGELRRQIREAHQERRGATVPRRD
jgi:hypothetical protein